MKKLISMILAVVMLITVCAVPTVTVTAASSNTAITPDTSWYSSSGTGPFYIRDAADLLGLVELTHSGTTAEAYAISQGKTFYLTADIDLNPGWKVGDATAPANIWKGIAAFAGTFDGQGHTISGMYAPNGLSSGPLSNEFGFVGRMIPGATIKNLNLTNGYLNGDTYVSSSNKGDTVGSFVGVMHWGNMENGTITIENCYSDLTIVCNSTAGDVYAGGIYGGSWTAGSNASNVININITNTSFAGSVSNSKNHNQYGQISGRAACANGNIMNATYTNCYYPTAGNVYSAVFGSANVTNNTAVAYVQESETVDGYYDIRILSGLDSLIWDEVGFEVSVTLADGSIVSKEYTATMVYKSVRAAGASVSASQLGDGYEYIYALVIENIPVNVLLTLTVKPFRVANTTKASAAKSAYAIYQNGKPVSGTWDELTPAYTYTTETQSYQADDYSFIKEYSNATKANFDAYLKDLTDTGFVLSQQNRLGNNYYALASSVYSSVYVSYIDSQKIIRVYTERSGLNTNPSDAPAATGTYEPKMWQLRVDNINSRENGGMSYVWLLSDGTFFVIDGGYNTTTEADNLYNFLVEKNPLEGEPVITGWYFSHGHGDHIGAIQAFAPKYADKVEVKSFYYHFETGYPTAFDRAMAYWPEATHYSRLHTGMKINLPGISVNVIYTLEDLYKTGFSYSNLAYNNNSTVIRVDVEADGVTQKVMYLGDIQMIASNRIVEWQSSEALKSDIVQFSHHGYEGATIALYDAIAAPTVLWPINLVSTQNNYGSICNVFVRWGMATRNSTWTEKDPITGASLETGFSNYYISYNAHYSTQILLAGDAMEADEITFPYTPTAYKNGLSGTNGRLPDVDALYSELLPKLVPDQSAFTFN